MSNTVLNTEERPYRRLSIKRFLPKTLFGRSLMILVTPVLLIQIIASFIFFDRHWSKMTTRLAFAVAGEIAVVAKAIEDDASPQNVERITRYAVESLDLLINYEPGAELGEHSRERVPQVWESMVAQTLSGEIRKQVRRPFTLDVDFGEKWVRVFVQLEGGVMNVSLPQGRLFSSSGYIFLIWMIATSLVLLMIAILFMRNQIKPIHKLALAADRFGKGRDVVSFKPQGAKEVRQAAQAFLDMRKRINRQVQQRTEMLAGVSHDLRTPLTRLKLQLAMLGDSPDIEAMKNDIQEMEKMIEGYLDFVRGEGDEQVSLTHMGGLVEKVVVSAKRQGLDITSDIDLDINLMLRPMAFERALANVIGNAGKYADHVWITARVEEQKLDIVIEDNGPGIPEAQYEEVFKPFYRVDSSRHDSEGSVGLGLPIAMDIVHSHGGKIWLDKSGRGGLKVCISLPL